jgi:light-regulated signal transduction histidine kinase (bacteriophytochrome)
MSAARSASQAHLAHPLIFRVLVYQFDDDWNGRCVAELVDWSKTHDFYKGLHFPASDIPKQARDLYAISKCSVKPLNICNADDWLRRLDRVRLLYDRSQQTARLVCKSEADLKTPLDMAHSFLRAMSPIHIKYLANMRVRASMSIVGV